ncbi:Fanconi anemia group A protein-like isoform X2 [Ostrea edulis]|uniref:Fanconi anemia group A protein-like isoform X2 n=1 Tax=Ostrea edulis TaxID=37623 RepID=UPI0024AF53E3|nr:Fanconi anemia group A protein-like isoform X2 [Ostrea edulis]
MSDFHLFEGVLDNGKCEVLSQGSRDELKNAALQLISYHYSNAAAVAEVADLLSSSTQNVKGVLKSCICLDSQSEIDTLKTLETCVSSVLRLVKDVGTQSLNEGIKEKMTNLIIMVREVVDRQTFNKPRLLNLFCNEKILPVFLLWVLHKEEVMSLNTYLSFKISSTDFVEAFSSELLSNSSIYGEETWILEILTLILRNSQSTQKDSDAVRLRKISKHVLDLLSQKILDELMLNSGTLKVIDLSKFCPIEILKQHFLGMICLWMAHRPVLKVADALKQQKDWTFSKLSSSLTQWYKQCLVLLEPEEVLEQMKIVMETQEVNWQTVLSFFSTAVVCMPQLSQLIQDYVISLLRDGLECSNLENLVIAFLFARQGCYEGPHVFASYPDWFQRTFSEPAHTPASSKRAFTCLIKFLTDMVPFESSSHLKAHIFRPPFVPPKCRELFTDYIMLAKTRMADLKQSLDAESDDPTKESRKKVNEQIETDIQKMLVVFDSNKKIPTSIMEASIFRKLYYVGKFLPILLKPRALPDIPDVRMKFIDALKLAEKIPSTLYNNYITACKAESSRLLEGVFLDEEEDMDIELSEIDQLQRKLDQIITALQQNPHNRVIEQCSLVREKLMAALHTVDDVYCITRFVLNIDAADISLPSLKVVDQLLEFVSVASQRGGTHSGSTVSWPQDFFTVLGEIKELHSILCIRIWKLVTDQGCELEGHHIRTLSFFLAHSDYMRLDSPEVEIRTCQSMCQPIRGKFTHLIWQELPVYTSAWQKFSLRLMTEFVKTVTEIRNTTVDFEHVLPEVFCTKFQFLYNRIQDLFPDDQSVNDFKRQKEDTKTFISKVKLSFRDWICQEMKVTFPDELLSYDDWQVHVHDTVFNRYLMDTLVHGSVDDRCRKMCSELFTELLHNMQSPVMLPEPMCKACKERKVHRQTGMCHYMTSVLQALVSCLQPDDKAVSWLAKQIRDEMRDKNSQLNQESFMQAVVRLISCLPAYLLFVDGLSMTDSVVLDLPCQIINEDFSSLCRHVYLPVNVTIYVLQGMCHLGNRQDVETILCKCPLLPLSIVVHMQFTTNLLSRLNKLHPCFELGRIMKVVTWVERCRMKLDVIPQSPGVDHFLLSAGLLALVHLSPPTVKEVIKQDIKDNDAQQIKIWKGFALFLVAELSDSKNRFYGDSEAAFDDLLSAAPDTLSYLAGSEKDEWKSLLPEFVFRLFPDTVLKFLKKKQSSWQSNSTFLSSVLLLYKELLSFMECSEEMLSDCGPDIVLTYKQAVAR